MTRTVRLLLFLLCLTTAAARPQVLVTTGQLADVVRNVAGEHATVTAMMGPGVDPHLYQATPRDIHGLQLADLILFHGLSLEGQLAEVLEGAARFRPTAAIAETAIPAAELLAADAAGLVPDPHVWMDARLFSLTAEAVAEELTAIDPDNGPAYRLNAATYRDELLALHDWIAAAIETIPEQKRQLVTAHDAFAYFGRAYGIPVAAVQGLSTESEAGIADIREIVRLLTRKEVPAIFVESTINPRTVQAVLEAARAAGHEARLGGELYSDALGPADQPEGTLIGMLVHNTTVITQALGGTVPALPATLDRWSGTWSRE